jgi:hypothetical protein
LLEDSDIRLYLKAFANYQNVCEQKIDFAIEMKYLHSKDESNDYRRCLKYFKENRNYIAKLNIIYNEISQVLGNNVESSNLSEQAEKKVKSIKNIVELYKKTEFITALDQLNDSELEEYVKIMENQDYFRIQICFEYNEFFVESKGIDPKPEEVEILLNKISEKIADPGQKYRYRKIKAFKESLKFTDKNAHKYERKKIRELEQYIEQNFKGYPMNIQSEQDKIKKVHNVLELHDRFNIFCAKDLLKRFYAETRSSETNKKSSSLDNLIQSNRLYLQSVENNLNESEKDNLVEGKKMY